MLNFEDIGLTVDWIGFKFGKLTKTKQRRLAQYFSNLGFNSYEESGRLTQPNAEPVIIKKHNTSKLFFIHQGPHWKGTYMQFTGKNASSLYTLIKSSSIDWNFFSDAVLGRFDLNYTKEITDDDHADQISDFLLGCAEKVMKTSKNVALERNSKGFILKVGTRRSLLYSRVYEQQSPDTHVLKFEHEIKGQAIKLYQTIIKNDLAFFEHQLTIHFLTYFGKNLDLTFCHTDWLAVHLRRLKQENFVLKAGSLKVDYIKDESFEHPNDFDQFCIFLQFILYLENLNYIKDSLGDTTYRLFQFRVADFMKYIKRSYNTYQLKKLIQFLESIQSNSSIKFFSNQEYRSLITIPNITLKKESKYWVASLWVLDDLFIHLHPFMLPGLLQDRLTKLQLEVQAFIIKNFGCRGVKKTFRIEEFLENRTSKLNSNTKKRLKIYFLELLQNFEKENLIESRFEIYHKGKIQVVNRLNVQDISESFSVFEKFFS